MQNWRFKIPRHIETLDQKFKEALSYVETNTVESVENLLNFYFVKWLINEEEYSRLKWLSNDVSQACINILDAIELLLWQWYINEAQYEKARMKYFDSIKK